MATAFSFIHCADLHLDSPFEKVESLEPEAPGRNNRKD